MRESAGSRICHPQSRAGFTLVEVALAIGIVAFAFVALLALLPAGNTAFRRAIDLTVAGQIGQRLLNEASQTDFLTLIDASDSKGPDPVGFAFQAPYRNDGLAYRYFDDEGTEVVPVSATSLSAEEKRRIVYEAGMRIITRVPVPGETSSTASATTDTPLVQVTVQVAHNPNHVNLPMSSAPNTGSDPSRRLWAPSAKQAGIDIYTYSQLISRAD